MTIKKCLYKTARNIVTLEDYVTLLLASVICASGLAINSETVVIGSMLISPMLKPIINIAISLLNWKPKVIIISIIHTIAMLSLSCLIAYFCGMIIMKYFPTIKDAVSKDENQTVLGRASLIDETYKAWAFPSMIAVCGGILLARSHCIENHINTTIIGIGISTSILPPVIAAGILLTGLNTSGSRYAGYSALLALVNIFLIFISYVITLFYSW